ncbi:MAG: leucine-rich repeat domain-containing protein [Aureliella sp.]
MKLQNTNASMLLLVAVFVAASAGCNDSAVPPIANRSGESADEIADDRTDGKESTDLSVEEPSEVHEMESAVAVLDELEPKPMTPSADFELLRGLADASKSDSDGNLTELHFRSEAVSDEVASEIGNCSTLVKLTINHSEMSLVGWEQLAKLTELQQFDLRGCEVDNEQLAAAVQGMPKLRALRLNGQSGDTTVDDLGMEVLKGCKSLKALALDHLWVGGDGLSELVGLNSLSELYLAGTLVEDDAMKVIAQFRGLKKLRLAQTSVGDVGMEAVIALPLEDLDLSECSQINNQALGHIGSMKSLKKLNLFKTVIADEGIADLAALKQLAWLNVDQTPVSDRGMETIGKLENLTFLHLGSTAVTDKGMPNLSSLKQLEKLIVTRTAVTQAGVEPLKQQNPQLSVQLKYVEGS